MIIEIKANGQTILKEDIWTILFLGFLKDGVSRLNPDATIEVLADGKEIEKPFWWDLDD